MNLFATPMQQWARLPRVQRDNLFLLGVLTVLALQMSRVLPIWSAVFGLGLLLWRIVIEVRNRPLPKKWLLAILLIAALAGIGFELVGRSSISGAALTLLLMLLALKTLEMQTRRDSMVLFFLGFFCIVTNFLYAQTISVALLMVLVFWGLLTALVNAHKPLGRPTITQSAKSSAFLVAIGLPFILALYILFPRFPPLWGIPTQPNQGTTGLSNSMSVGTIANLAQDRSIALRLSFDPNATIPPQSQMYFRGPVLNRLNGRHWTSEEDASIAPNAPIGSINNPIEPIGSAIAYEMVLEPHQQRWLLPLETMVAQPNGLGAGMSRDGVWHSYRPVNSATRYQATSYLQASIAKNATEKDLRRYLQLPDGDNARTKEWAQELKARFENTDSSTSTSELVGFVLNWLHTEEYHYTLQPPMYGPDTADDFWFTYRSGFCEHIASAFAVLMRAADIPARIVTGYQGGERNPVNNVWTVRQSDAHAWVEVWVAGQGWLRIDPTAAIAPDRINLSQSQALEQSGDDARAQGFGGRIAWLLSSQAWLDAIDYRWTQWVLNYNQDNQQSLLSRFGFSRLNWTQIIVVAVSLLLLTVLAYFTIPFIRQARSDPWERMIHQTHKRLHQAGLNMKPNTPPRRMAALSQAFFGDSATSVSQWLIDMDALRYARQPKDTLPNLMRRWKRLSWPAPHTDT